MKIRNKVVSSIVLSMMLPLILSFFPLEVRASAGESNKDAITFPQVTKKTGKNNSVRHMVTNNKGTIIAQSWNYLDVTFDYGKTWTTRKMPRDANYQLQYNNGLFYLSVSDYKGTESYYSEDGVAWTPFTLRPPAEVNREGSTNLSIKEVFNLNGKWILYGSGYYDVQDYIFSSQDGKEWSYEGLLPTKKYFQMFWDGKKYSAILNIGYSYYGDKAQKPGPYRVTLSSKPLVTAEMVVYTSPDLKTWKQVSGLTPGNPYGVYFYEDNNLWYDGFSNQLSTTDGVNFKIAKRPKLFQENRYQYAFSKVYKKGDTYYVFANDWISSGVVHTRVYTSKDKTNWKTTKINVLNGMNIIQSGDKFIGYGYDDEGKIVISDDGIQWKRIK